MHLTKTTTRAEATPREWLPVGGEIADFVNRRAQRSDIIAYVGEGAGGDAAACFWPAGAEIELNVQEAFGKLARPSDIGKLSDRQTLFDWPKATGALIHESAHARWTRWDLMLLNDLDPLLAEVLQCFEESRIERLAVDAWPRDVAFLRSSAKEIVMDGLDLAELKKGAPFYVARLMLLTTARRDAGSLEDEDVEELEELFAEFFGPIVFDMFERLYRTAQKINVHDDRCFDYMLPLGQAWMKLLPENTDLSAGLKAKLEEIAEIIADAVESAEVGGVMDAGDQETVERGERLAEESEAAAKEDSEHKKAAARVFGKSTAEIPDHVTASRVQETRAPTAEERAAAMIIAREIAKAKYRDRVTSVTRSELPPGRLQTRDALQAMAQRAQGSVPTAQPWATTRRKHVEDPNLTIGVLVDISGSMNRVMLPMAVTAYVLAEAGYRNQARMAMVYYGNSAFPTLKPGQRQDHVVVRSAADGTERFNEAFKALDGELQLLNGSGARLLVICSDMCYTGTEGPATTQWVDRCVKAGVGVLCLPFDAGKHVAAKNLNPKAHVITGRLDPVAAATLIGQTAVKALESASAGR